MCEGCALTRDKSFCGATVPPTVGLFLLPPSFFRPFPGSSYLNPFTNVTFVSVVDIPPPVSLYPLFSSPFAPRTRGVHKFRLSLNAVTAAFYLCLLLSLLPLSPRFALTMKLAPHFTPPPRLLVPSPKYFWRVTEKKLIKGIA